MKSVIIIFAILLISLTTGCDYFDKPSGIYHDGIISISFDPDKSEKLIVHTIRLAQETIDISLYGFENINITDEILQAAERGVKIRCVTEFDSENQIAWQKLIVASKNFTDKRITVKMGNDNGIMHNKYIITDKKYVITGSANLTEGLYKHFNNLVIIKNVKLAAEYQKDFDILFAGYFSSEKGNDDYGSGYSILYGYQPWETNHIVDNNLNISIYFTPYTAVFSDYKKSSPVEYRYYDYDKESDVSEKYANAMNVIFPLIEQANNSIYIYSYAFTDKALMSLLAKAYDRGVKIFLWLDYSQFNSNYAHSGQSIIALSKIIGNVRLCRKENGGLLHHKVMIIDRKTVLFGSLNFSSNAVTSNDENFLIIRDNTGIAEYFIQESNNINKYSNKLRIKETEDTTNAENIE